MSKLTNISKLIKKYSFIYLWEKQLGSDINHIHTQLVKAEAENAPITSIYKRSHVKNKKWITIDECNWSAEEKLEFYQDAVQGIAKSSKHTYSTPEIIPVYMRKEIV